MEISIKWNICRVCLQEENKSVTTGQMRNMFNEGNKLAQHIYDCTSITMKPNDSLPDKICQKCLEMVNTAINFRITCRSSDTYLQSVLQRTKSASSLFKPDERLHTENFDEEGEVVELEPLIESEDTIVEQCIEQFPNTRAKYINSGIINDFNAKALNSNEINKATNSEKIPKNELQYYDVFIEHTEGEEVEIIEVVKNIGTNTKHISTDAKREKIKTTQKNDNVYKTDIEQLEENIEELYYVVKEAKKEDNILSSKNKSISEDKINQEEEDENRTSENNFEYLDIEEDNDIEELAMEIDDNQAQVSSTVETNDDFDLLHENSNLSNVTDNVTGSKTYIEEKYLNKIYCSQNTNIKNSNKLPTESRKIRGLRNVTVRTSTVTLGKHNIKYKNNESLSDNRLYEPQKYVCKICGNQFNNRHTFHLHLKKHRQERNHQCELCYKRFYTACNLQAHMRIHTGEKPFECQYCGRRFSDRSSNLRHERIHTNEKPFQCINCGRSFALATTLQSHMKIHTGERSYRCEPCGKSFKLPHHLKSHQMTTQHKAVQELEINCN